MGSQVTTGLFAVRLTTTDFHRMASLDAFWDALNVGEGHFSVYVNSVTKSVSTDKARVVITSIDRKEHFTDELGGGKAVPDGPFVDVLKFEDVAEGSWYKGATIPVRYVTDNTSPSTAVPCMDRWVTWVVESRDQNGNDPDGTVTVVLEISATIKGAA